MELFRTMDGERYGSLFWHLNRTVSAMGARTLASWLRFPLTDLEAIQRRQEVLGFAIKRRRRAVRVSICWQLYADLHALRRCVLFVGKHDERLTNLVANYKVAPSDKNVF